MLTAGETITTTEEVPIAPAVIYVRALKEFRDRVAAAAKRDGVSVNTFAIAALEGACEDNEAFHHVQGNHDSNRVLPTA
jgi:hypothetical protein